MGFTGGETQAMESALLLETCPMTESDLPQSKTKIQQLYFSAFNKNLTVYFAYLFLSITISMPYFISIDFIFKTLVGS